MVPDVFKIFEDCQPVRVLPVICYLLDCPVMRFGPSFAFSQGCDPGSFFVNCFLCRRPDGVAINEALKIVYILEFKRSTDSDDGLLEVKDAKANEQHKSIIGALKVAAPEWEFEQINFVVGNRGSVVESDFYTKLKKLDIQEGKKNKLFTDHVTQVCEAHNRVTVSFLQQVQGGTRPTTEGSRENIGHNVHV